MKKNLRKELLKIAQNWNASGIGDGSEFEGRYFISDDHLTEFAEDNGFVINDAVQEEIEAACDCKFIYDYEGSNPNRQFGDQEVIFNN